MKKLNIRSILIILFVTLFQLSKAQITPQDTSRNKIITLGEIVISANKIEESKKTVAQQIQIITSKEIVNSQAQSTADLLANNANIFVQKSQMGGGSPVLRGFEASRIVLVVDGVRMNNIIYRAGHLQNIITLDNSIIDRVEILSGPASTIYGSDALGGVIHFYTKNPMLASGGEKTNLQVNAFTRYGSVNDEMKGHFDVNIGKQKFASLTSFTYSKFGDLKGGENQNPFYDSSYGERTYYAERIDGKDSLVKNSDRYLQKQSAYNQYDLLEKLLYQQNEHISHGLNIQYSNSTDVPRYDRLTDPKGSGLKYAEWYYGPQMRLLTAYNLNIKNPDAIFQNIHCGISFQNIEESRHSRKFGNDNLAHNIENVNIIGADIDFQKVISRHNIRFGLDAQYNMLKSTANSENIITRVISPAGTRYPDGDNTMLNTALYVSHTWRINDELILNDGIRAGFSSLHSTFVDTTFFKLPYTSAEQNTPVYSGSLGLIHTLDNDWKLSLTLSTGFRVPNVDDLSKVFESAPGMLIVPNADLKPEQTVNSEIGITKIIEGKAILENSIYYTQFSNAIVTDKFQYEGNDSIMYDGSMSAVYANQNKKEAFLYGFSSSFKAQWSSNFIFSLMFNYTYGRIKTDTADYPLDHVPPFMARTMLSYNDNKFAADFFINYNGAKKLKDYNLGGEDNEQYATPMGMPAWFTVNLRAAYQITNSLSLQAGIENIFDTQYRAFASGINAPGRNIYGSLKFNL